MTLNHTGSNGFCSTHILIMTHTLSATILLLSSGCHVKTTPFGQFLCPTFFAKELAVTAEKSVAPHYVCGRKMSSGTLSKL